LDQDDFADPLWMIGEEHFKGMKFLRDTFDVVQPIDSYNQLDPFELAREDGDAILYPLFLEGVDEFIGINAYRECCNRYIFPPEFNSIRGCRCFPAVYEL
jgi:hypothetical protein